MSEAKLILLYPHPIDTGKFDRDYEVHIKLLREKLQLPENARPYSVTRFMETPMGKPAYYQMFTFTFPSIEAMQQGLSSPAMAALGEDANRISTGGAPTIMVGLEGELITSS